MANLINLGIRGTANLRKALQDIARERNTSVQALVIDVLEEYISRYEKGAEEWSKALERIPVLSAEGKESLYLHAQVRARIPDNHPTNLAIDSILVEIASRIGGAVVKKRSGPAYKGRDIREYWSSMDSAFKWGGRHPDDKSAVPDSVDEKPAPRKPIRKKAPRPDKAEDDPSGDLLASGATDGGEGEGPEPAIRIEARSAAGSVA
jgi:hypothetical protein